MKKQRLTATQAQAAAAERTAQEAQRALESERVRVNLTLKGQLARDWKHFRSLPHNSMGTDSNFCCHLIWLGIRELKNPKTE